MAASHLQLLANFILCNVNVNMDVCDTATGTRQRDSMTMILTDIISDKQLPSCSQLPVVLAEGQVLVLELEWGRGLKMPQMLVDI